MARTDTLTNFLTDVASAIKTKKGDQTDILASNFDTEIANLPSGGGDVSNYFNTTYDENVVDPYNSFGNTTVKKFPTITIANGTTSLHGAFAGTLHVNMSFDGIDCSNITDMSNMFQNNLKIETINLENITNTSNVTDVRNIFSSCLASTISNIFPLTGNVKCGNAFSSCSNIKKLDLSNWNITNDGSANSIFNGTNNLAILDISNITFPSVASNTFKNCGVDCLQSDGAYADGVPYVYVKDSTEQQKILEKVTTWSTSNVIVKSN